MLPQIPSYLFISSMYKTMKCKLEALSGCVFEINWITTHFYYFDCNPLDKALMYLHRFT